ncbi:GATA-type transcription factor [Scheffersomyces xylosifermentans]|uniref:GATA-type transcription factor n=1 Tax=Scheffersomyces xylosifermentans TaxID=1304137 RepID=UPI00315DA29F
MSLVQPVMYDNQLNSFTQGHLRSRSYNELLNQFKSSISSSSSASSPPESSSAIGTSPSYVKKRSHSDLVRQSAEVYPSTLELSKRSRTAPPSPPYESTSNFASTLSSTSSISDRLLTNTIKPNKTLRSRSLSPNKKFSNPLSPSHSPNSSPVASPSKPASATGSSSRSGQTSKDSKVENNNDEQRAKRIKLPSLSTALKSAITTKTQTILKPITPTVSLDYFDTYKPNDENWRYELLDTINKESKHFHLNQYNYLNKYATSSPKAYASLTNGSSSSYSYKPNFDSRISSKISQQRTTLPSVNEINQERKINFPYESNYTYLNKTYMNDVEKYPEYLELAQSLIQLSQPRQQTAGYQQNQSQEPVSSPTRTGKNELPVPAQIPTTVASPTSVSYSPNTSVAPPPPSVVTPVAGHFYQSPKTAESTTTNYNSGALTPPSSRLPSIQSNKYNTYLSIISENPKARTPELVQLNHAHHAHNHTAPSAAQAHATQQNHKFIPITPPSSKSKSRSELLKSPPKHHHNHNNPRVCISCGSDQSPCWRPSWSIKEGQLCNSCGLRYKKTSARCLNKNCKKIPAKGEWSLMQSKGQIAFEDGIEGYSCLECGWRVEVRD